MLALNHQLLIDLSRRTFATSTMQICGRHPKATFTASPNALNLMATGKVRATKTSRDMCSKEVSTNDRETSMPISILSTKAKVQFAVTVCEISQAPITHQKGKQKSMRMSVRSKRKHARNSQAPSANDRCSTRQFRETILIPYAVLQG